MKKFTVFFRIWLRTQVYDGSKIQGFEEGEIDGAGEARSEDVLFNHGEVGGRDINGVVCNAIFQHQPHGRMIKICIILDTKAKMQTQKKSKNGGEI